MNIHSNQAYLSYPSIANDTIVFTRAGSVWQVDRQGGVAKPLVRGFHRIGTPVIDPTREYLAFVAAEDSVAQIYWQSSAGEIPKRMTSFQDSCRIRGWNADGRLMFTTASGSAFRQNLSSWLLDLDTGDLEQQPVGTLSITHCASDGTRLGGPSAVNPRFWRSYKGGASGQIWIDDQGDGHFRQLLLTDDNIANPVLYQDRVWFVLDGKEGCNLHSISRAGEDLRQHTRHDQFPIHSLATDGTGLVYCRGGALFLWAGEGEEKSIVTEFCDGDDNAAEETARTTLDLRLVGGDAGTGLLGLSYGDLFDYDVNKEKLSEIECASEVRDAACLADGRLLVVAAGKQGDKLVLIDSTRTAAKEFLPGSEFGRINYLAVASSTPLAVVANHRHQLLLVNVANASVSLLDRSDFQPIQQVDLSADGRLCAYSVAVGQYRTVLRVVRTADAALVAETDPDLADFSPRFKHDDSVVFLSMYPPANGGAGFVTAVHTIRPIEEGSWLTTELPLQEHDLQISRIETSPLAIRGLLCLGTHLLLQLPPTGGDPAVTPLPGIPSVWVTMAESAFCCGEHAVVIGNAGDWFMVQFPPNSGHKTPVIQPIGSREIFRTSGSLPVAFCVRELLQLVGQHVSPDSLESVNWDSVAARYHGMTRLPTSSHELDTLLNEILGCLTSSHAHVSSPEDDTVQAPDLSSKSARCLVGNNKPEKTVFTTGKGPHSRARAYAIWVLQRRQFVRQASAGKIDYYHLPDVSEYTRACFEYWLKCRDMSDKLILDVRYNDGGVCGADIAQLLLNQPLARVATRRSRITAQPAGSARRHVVLLANRFTSSGGELLIAALRQQAGSVVIGERTYGGGIGHTFSHALPHSSSVLLPELLIKSPHDWSAIENYGVAPDIALLESSELIEMDLILRTAVSQCMFVD